MNVNFSSAHYDYNVHIYKKNNLIYVAIPKCGSTYYVSLLLENGWDQIPITQIDWTNDHVVAFIRDVKERYITGLIEDLYQTQYPTEPNPELEYIIYQNLKYIVNKYPKEFFLLSWHTVPITQKLGDLVDLIDWIPIAPNFDHNKIFFNLCERFQCPILITESENIDPHHSHEFKKYYQNDLMQSLPEQTPENTWLFRLLYSGDIEIYNAAKAKYNLI